MADIPFALLYGRVGQVTATIPWRNIWSDPCQLELESVELGLIALADLPRTGTYPLASYRALTTATRSHKVPTYDGI